MVKEKYINLIQQFIDDNNLGFTVKDLKFKDVDRRFVYVVFKERYKTAEYHGNLSASCMIAYSFNVYTHTQISGDHYGFLSDEMNAKLHKVSMFLANLFWIWLSYYDVQIPQTLKIANEALKYKALCSAVSAFQDRSKNHPEETEYITFKDAIANYNEQLAAGFFNKKAGPTIDYFDDFDFDNFKYIDSKDNIFS